MSFIHTTAHKITTWLWLLGALCLLLPSKLAAQEAELTLPDAIRNEQVQAEIVGRNIAYVQPMVLLRLTNQTDQPLLLTLQQGLQLQSNHPSYANVVVLQTETLTLPPAETISHTIYAYSLQVDLAFPIPTATFTAGQLTDNPNLLALLGRIEDNNAEATLAAQLAVWMQLEGATDFDQFVARFGSTIDLQPQRQLTRQLLGESSRWVGIVTAVFIPLLFILIPTLAILLPRYLRKQFDGHRLITHLATGAKYHIQQAHQRGSGQIIAIKQPIDDPAEARCLREIEIREQIAHEQHAQTIRHAPHIVPLHTSGYFGSDKNSRPRPYFVETYIDGADLSKVLTERPKLGTAITLEIISQLIEALRYLHQQLSIVHRELKPSNILVDKRGHIWLTDFAAAAAPQQAELNQVKRGEGNELYWNAPEYIQYKHALFYANGHPPPANPLIQNQQVDIFSLGVLLYQLSTGKSPFMGQTGGTLFQPPTVRPDAFMELEPRLGVAIQQCLDSDPANRFTTVTALQHALGLPLSADVTSRAQAELGRLVQDVMPAVKSS